MYSSTTEAHKVLFGLFMEKHKTIIPAIIFHPATEKKTHKTKTRIMALWLYNCAQVAVHPDLSRPILYCM